MKLLVFVTLLLSLQFAVLASAQSLSEMIYDLIALNENERAASATKITLKNDETKKEINRQLNANAIPAINQLLQGVNDYIGDLETSLTSAGYNPTSCVLTIQALLGVLPNLTDQAVTEANSIYEELASDIHFNGLYNLGIISNEVVHIATDFTMCVGSASPQYCNGTLVQTVVAKRSELPILYSKSVATAAIAFTQLMVSYENRVHDYIEEAIAVSKPYLALLDSCVSFYITVDQ